MRRKHALKLAVVFFLDLSLANRQEAAIRLSASTVKASRSYALSNFVKCGRVFTPYIGTQSRPFLRLCRIFLPSHLALERCARVAIIAEGNRLPIHDYLALSVIEPDRVRVTKVRILVVRSAHYVLEALLATTASLLCLALRDF